MTMTNATAAYQCPAISPRMTAGHLPPVRLNTHQVELYRGPTSPRLATTQTGKRLRDGADLAGRIAARVSRDGL
jgi:hypothetical protein